MPHDLFPLLHNRMNRENQVTPQFIGEFDGVDSLPKGGYPAVYFWVDKSIGGNIRLSFNTPLLEDWCVEEARRAGINISIDDESVKRAIATLQQVATPAFQSMLSKLGG
ncbi:MAG: hypothetical protein BroJett021_34110 [Chloroflexota bacterium]|nr:MAG: hypothetical protein BroJett021_34110 [Chloroflexota bacterium]